MIEFALGTIVGAASGYAARAWLSARRRRAARAARIAKSAGIAGSGQRHFVPFKSEGVPSKTDDEASSMIVRLQPGPSEAGRVQAKEFRIRGDSAAGI